MTDTLEHHSEDVLFALINTTPALQSLLYDIDMMPEQILEDSYEWKLMLAYAWAYQAGLAARNEWQSIETAPKDGSEILTYRGAGLQAVAAWITDNTHSFWCVTDGMGLIDVTHWMPLLPSPPEEK